MVRGLPIIFSQRDFLQPLGFSPSVTISQSGCLLTSFAMIARYYGKATDPVDLNRAFKAANLYLELDDLADDDLTKIFPDVVFQESLLYPNEPPTPADLTKLKELLDDPTLSVILEIDMGGGNTHFAPCVGVNGVVTIANPWDKTVEDFSANYGDPVKNILKYIVYKGTPASVDQQLLDQLRQQRDANWNLHLEDIAQTQMVKNQLSGTQTQLNETKQKYDESEKEVIAINGALETLTKTNKDYASEAYTAEQAENSLRDLLHMLANQVGISNVNLKDKDLADATAANIDVIQIELKNRSNDIEALKQSLPKKIVDSVINKSFWQKFLGWFFEPNPS